MFWKRLIVFFTPSPGAFSLLWAALIIMLILTATSIVAGIDDPKLADGTGVIISVCAIPAGMLLLQIATFVERKPGARFLLWSGVSGLLGISIGTLFFATPVGAELVPSGVVLVCFCLPVLSIPIFGLIFLGLKAYPAFRQTLRAARLQRLIEIIQARGEVKLANLCAELSLEERRAQNLIRELIAIGELMAYFDEEHQIVYSAALLGEKQRRLLPMVTAKGQAKIDELAGELKVRRKLVRQWIYTLAERRQIHGFVDWADGVIYSQEVEKVLAENRCPHCGGQLEVAGKSLIQCAHCGVEVFQ